MSAITIPESLKSSFGVTEETPVCDEHGNVLGFYTPVCQGTKEDYEWARQQFTKEDIEAARNEQGGYTTAEVLAYLRNLKQ